MIDNEKVLVDIAYDDITDRDFVVVSCGETKLISEKGFSIRNDAVTAVKDILEAIKNGKIIKTERVS